MRSLGEVDCHNLCCLIHAMEEFGIDPNFWRARYNQARKEPAAMPSKFGPWGSESSAPHIDLNKRYDVYCIDRANCITVYRNAKFKSKSILLGEGHTTFADRFIELEQSNGQSVYIAAHSIARFCEHDVQIVDESLLPEA